MTVHKVGAPTSIPAVEMPQNALPSRAVVLADARDVAPPRQGLRTAPAAGDALRAPRATAPGAALQTDREKVLEAEITAASTSIEDPANDLPDFAIGQGLERRGSGTDRFLRYEVRDIKDGVVTLRDVEHGGTTTRTVAELESEARREHLIVRAGADLEAPRAPSRAELQIKAIAPAVSELSTLRVHDQLGPTWAPVFVELLQRRRELIDERDSASKKNADWHAAHDTQIIRTTPPEANHLAVVEGQLAEVDQALSGLASKRDGFGFTPTRDAVVMALRNGRPNDVDIASTNVAMMRGAIAQGQYITGFAAYQAAIKPHLTQRNASGESYYTLANGTASLTAAINQTIANARGNPHMQWLGTRPFVTSEAGLEALRPLLQNPEHWAAVDAAHQRLTAGGSLQSDHPSVPFPTRAFDGEARRLHALDAEPKHRALEPAIAQAHALVPELAAMEPGFLSRHGRAALDTINSYRFLGTVAGTAAAFVATDGLGAAVLGTSEAGAAGTAGLRASALLSRGSAVWATTTAIDGAAGVTGGNFAAAMFGEKPSWSVDTYLLGIAMLGAGRLAAGAHNARLDAIAAPDRAALLRERARYTAEAVGPQTAMVAAADAVTGNENDHLDLLFGMALMHQLGAGGSRRRAAADTSPRVEALPRVEASPAVEASPPLTHANDNKPIPKNVTPPQPGAVQEAQRRAFDVERFLENVVRDEGFFDLRVLPGRAGTMQGKTYAGVTADGRLVPIGRPRILDDAGAARDVQSIMADLIPEAQRAARTAGVRSSVPVPPHLPDYWKSIDDRFAAMPPQLDPDIFYGASVSRVRFDGNLAEQAHVKLTVELTDGTFLDLGPHAVKLPNGELKSPERMRNEITHFIDGAGQLGILRRFAPDLGAAEVARVVEASIPTGEPPAVRAQRLVSAYRTLEEVADRVHGARPTDEAAFKVWLGRVSRLRVSGVSLDGMSEPQRAAVRAAMDRALDAWAGLSERS